MHTFVNIRQGVHLFFLYVMVKPVKEMIFHEMGGIWRSADGVVLADFLAEYSIVVDDRCEFARLRDYERSVSIWYRASAGKVKITFWAFE